MVHIKVTKGLDIPIEGRPAASEDTSTKGLSQLIKPAFVSLNLSCFDDIKFKLLTKVGDVVKIGQPLAEDKESPGRVFVSPAGGVIKDIKRGLKRSLQEIVIEVGRQEEFLELGPISVESATSQQILERLMASGLFAHIYSRPLNFLANPLKPPKSIFVKAIESALFVPPAELQVSGYEKEFQIGLTALSKLTSGPVHLVYRKDTPLQAFSEAQHVQKHTVEGPHPAGNSSLHIQKITRITSSTDVIWTINAHSVVAIGHQLLTGRYFIDRVIGIGGPGILPDKVGYFKGRAGYPVGGLIAGRIHKGLQRFVSGDPLMGSKVAAENFLGYRDYAFCVIPEQTEREFLYFFKLGLHKYTYSWAYMSGHLDNQDKEYAFTTSQHGEHRAFVDGHLYDTVNPLEIPTMLLVKAVMAEDFELAEAYGLLEVDSEDFALPTFVCPSKIEMTEIIKQGLRQYAKEISI